MVGCVGGLGERFDDFVVEARWSRVRERVARYLDAVLERDLLCRAGDRLQHALHARGVDAADVDEQCGGVWYDVHRFGCDTRVGGCCD